MKVENTLLWNRMLQLNGYPILTYVYTSDEIVKRKAIEANCVPREIKHRNIYGLPVIPSILQDLHSITKCPFIGYINSDILLNPDSFSLLRFFVKHRKDYNISGPVCSYSSHSSKTELAARVCQYSNEENIRQQILSQTLFKKQLTCKLRNIGSAVDTLYFFLQFRTFSSFQGILISTPFLLALLEEEKLIISCLPLVCTTARWLILHIP